MNALAILLLTLSTAAPGNAGTVAGAPEMTSTVSVEKVVETLMADLGAARYDVRERATEALRRIGAPAIPALEKAADSDDPEIRTRAREILADARLGISPDWPSEMVLLVRHYSELGDNERMQALYRIGQTLREKAVPFLLARLTSENAQEANYALSSIQRINSDEAAQRVIALLKEPKNVYQNRALAWARYRTGAPVEALRLLVAGQPNDALRNEAIEAGVKKVLALLEDQQYDKAAQAARDMGKTAPDDARFAYLEAEALVALDKGDEAKALREKALAMNPNDESRHYAAADMLEDLGRRRLAAAEWETILKVPPDGSVYDINANMRLAAIYEDSGMFDRAAKSLQTAYEQFQKARQAGQGVAIAGGTEEELQMHIQRLTQRAAQFPPAPDAAIEDEIAENELRLAIAIVVKDGKGDDLRRDLAAAASISLNVQPVGLRLFDDVPITLHYDPAKKEIVALLGQSPCGKPAPMDLSRAGAEARLAVASLDRIYIFAVNTATGEMKETARYDKDYVLTFKPGTRLLALTDAQVKINGKGYAWDELQKGVTLDSLPKELDVTVEGTTPAGRHITAHARLRVREPALPPPAKAGG
jgi:tetratricopeptide (TPR) repeat protein